MDTITVRPERGRVNTRPFAKIPHDLAADPRLLPIDVRLLLALAYFARQKDHCWPSDTTLGSRIGRVRGTVQRRLRHLEALGLIRREKVEPVEGNRTGRILRLLWVDGATPPVAPADRPPAPPARHELRIQEKNTPASPSSPVSTGTTTPGVETGDRPATPSDWADLRRLRERPGPVRLADALGRRPRVN